MLLLAGSAAAIVVAGIVLAASLWGWTDGDRLPSEQEVAQRFAGAPAPLTVVDAPAVVNVAGLGLPGEGAAVVASARGAADIASPAPIAMPADYVILVPQPSIEPSAATAPAGIDDLIERPASLGKAVKAPAGFATANLRERPSTAARSLALLNNGTTVDVLPDTASADGFVWVHARTADGAVGWIVSTAVES
jgi:hypothetical protein